MGRTSPAALGMLGRAAPQTMLLGAEIVRYSARISHDPATASLVRQPKSCLTPSDSDTLPLGFCRDIDSSIYARMCTLSVQENPLDWRAFPSHNGIGTEQPCFVIAASGICCRWIGGISEEHAGAPPSSISSGHYRCLVDVG